MRDLRVERERSALLYASATTERQRLQAVFDHSPEGILFVEKASIPHLLLNPAAVALLGPVLPGTDLRTYLTICPIYRPD
jgi:hypothetical protein